MFTYYYCSLTEAADADADAVLITGDTPPPLLLLRSPAVESSTLGSSDSVQLKRSKEEATMLATG